MKGVLVNRGELVDEDVDLLAINRSLCKQLDLDHVFRVRVRQMLGGLQQQDCAVEAFAKDDQRGENLNPRVATQLIIFEQTYKIFHVISECLNI